MFKIFGRTILNKKDRVKIELLLAQALDRDNHDMK